MKTKLILAALLAALLAFGGCFYAGREPVTAQPVPLPELPPADGAIPGITERPGLPPATRQVMPAPGRAVRF
jgi:hypothetical protein